MLSHTIFECSFIFSVSKVLRRIARRRNLARRRMTTSSRTSVGFVKVVRKCHRRWYELKYGRTLCKWSVLYRGVALQALRQRAAYIGYVCGRRAYNDCAVRFDKAARWHQYHSCSIDRAVMGPALRFDDSSRPVFIVTESLSVDSIATPSILPSSCDTVALIWNIERFRLSK